MSVYFVIAPCLGCGIPFPFNPDRVPSLRVNDEGQPDPRGRRQPVCRTCWGRRQAYRREQGLPEETLLDGAYAPVAEHPDEDSYA